MFNVQGFLEDGYVESQALEDDQYKINLFTLTPSGRRDTLKSLQMRGHF